MVFFLHVIFLPLSHPFTSNPIKVYYIFGEKNESRALCIFRITSNPTSGKVAMVHTKRTLFLSIVLIVALSLDPARSFAHTVNLKNKAGLEFYWNILFLRGVVHPLGATPTILSVSYILCITLCQNLLKCLPYFRVNKKTL